MEGIFVEIFSQIWVLVESFSKRRVEELNYNKSDYLVIRLIKENCRLLLIDSLNPGKYNSLILTHCLYGPRRFCKRYF
ncbi:hypothetical protein Lnau_0632 [Legionella nautarum]|uniref:Uncharacterized protein n=1 Tax=Legionella nautarum TaxID=45070 RepID=A0A0W0WZG4_9GAMM|nr:hypothetical protein Lnau_0632 [Legionella nautarum]